MNRKIKLNDTIPYPKEKDSKIPIGKKRQEIRYKPVLKGCIPRVINKEKHNKYNNHMEETAGPESKPNKIILPVLLRQVSRQSSRQTSRQSSRQSPRQNTKQNMIKKSPYINKVKKPVKKNNELPKINQNKKELPRCISEKYIVKKSKTENNEEKEHVKNLPDVIKDTLQKKDLRVSALNDIQKEKSYVKIFLEQEEINNKRYYYIDQGIRNRNELLVCTKIPDESDVTYFNLMIYFDKYDDVDITFETDPEFFDSLFYSEVIITQRYKEAWQIIRQKYQEIQWIHKFIHFLLAAPSIIPLLME